MAVKSVLRVLYVLGCGAAPAPMEHAGERIALEHVRPVCWEAPEAKGSDYFVIPDHDGVAIGISEKDLQAVGLQIERIGFIYQYAPDARADSLRLIPLSRPDAWCTNVPQPTDEKVRQLLEVCPAPEATPQGQGPAVAKNLLGQTNQPVRSTYFCGQRPRMAPTSQELILLRARRDAYQVAYQQAVRTARALTQAKADIDEVTNKDASWLKQALTKDPGTIEQIQQRLADELNSIEEPTEYQDPKLDMLALAGFQQGFEDGKFQVEATLFAIDVGVLVLEVVAFEIAMGPLGGAKLVASAVSKGAKAATVVAGKGAQAFRYTKTKGGQALEAAMQRLGELPIFIPGAVGGPGATVKVRAVLKALSRYHARKLETAMFDEAALLGKNLVKLVTDETHHIVAHGAQKAEKAREYLARWGIDIDHPANGVFLPGTKKAPNPKGSIVHKTLSNNDLYYQKVTVYLKEAKSQADAIRRLRRIGETLEDGTFYNAIP